MSIYRKHNYIHFENDIFFLSVYILYLKYIYKQAYRTKTKERFYFYVPIDNWEMTEKNHQSIAEKWQRKIILHKKKLHEIYPHLCNNIKIKNLFFTNTWNNKYNFYDIKEVREENKKLQSRKKKETQYKKIIVIIHTLNIFCKQCQT